MRRRILVLLVSALGLAAPSSALAAGPKLEPGVHVDPGSPAGKQYQIPISSARSEAAGGTGASNGTAPAFGVGVTPGGPGGSGGSSGSAGGAGASATHGHAVHRARRHAAAGGGSATQGSAGQEAAATSHPASVASGDAGPGGGDDAWPLLAAGGLLVLVLGGGAGLALRRSADLNA